MLKRTEDRTRFYVHEVEIQEKLADVFNKMISNNVESASSKLSIAKKWEQVKTTSQIKSTQNRGTFSKDTGNIYKQPQIQTKATNKGKDTFRGAFVPEYRFIAITSNLATKTRLTHGRTAKRRTSPPQNNTFFRPTDTKSTKKTAEIRHFFSFFPVRVGQKSQILAFLDLF